MRRWPVTILPCSPEKLAGELNAIFETFLFSEGVNDTLATARDLILYLVPHIENPTPLSPRGRMLFLEWCNGEKLSPAFFDGLDIYGHMEFLTTTGRVTFPIGTENHLWRAWTDEPTDEQRRKVAWE